MFSESAALYDRIYKQMKNYEEEAIQVRAWVRNCCPAARTILDVACGTGEHAKYLKAHFQVDGTDLNPDFLKIAQSKNAVGLYKICDMTDFDMGKKYDAVVCLFSSIGYVATLEKLRKAIRCFAKHLTDDGVMLVEPWLTPEKWSPGKLHTITVTEDDLNVCRMNVSETKDGNLSFFRFHCLVGTPTGVSHFTEDHTLGLFTLVEIEQAFSEAGLTVRYDGHGIFGRGLYIAERAAKTVDRISPN